MSRQISGDDIHSAGPETKTKAVLTSSVGQAKENGQLGQNMMGVCHLDASLANSDRECVWVEVSGR